MENASKALMMAGSVLLTILVLGMLMLLFTQISEAPRAQEEALELAQITKFNREYESYDKEEMYGVDVVTVLNKAIANNKSYANPINGKYLKEDNNYYIDVEIKVWTDVVASATEYREVNDSNGITVSVNGKDEKRWVDVIPIKGKKVSGYIDGGTEHIEIDLNETSFKAGTTKNLLEESGTQVFMNEGIVGFLGKEETYKIKKDGTTKFDDYNYTIIDSGLKEFKRKRFKCTGVILNPETSRVSKIKFEEILR